MSSELPLVERCNCLPAWEFIWGDQSITSVVPIVLRYMISLIAFILVVMIDVWFLFVYYVKEIVSLVLFFRYIIITAFVGAFFYFIQRFWPEVVIFLDWFFELLEVVLNLLIMFLNLVIQIYGLYAMVWNLLVPFIGMYLYIALDLLLLVSRLIGKFFGGGGNRSMLGLGDGLATIVEVLMKVVNIFVEIALEILMALLKVAIDLLLFLANIIGTIMTVYMSLLKIMLPVIMFVFKSVFVIIKPIIMIIGFFFGSLGSSSRSRSSRSMQGMDPSKQNEYDYMFNGMDVNQYNMNKQRELDEQVNTDRKYATLDDADVDPHKAWGVFVHHTKLMGREHGFGDAGFGYGTMSDHVDIINDYHSDPRNQHDLIKASKYQRYHRDQWFDSEDSPLTYEERQAGAIKRLKMNTEHPILSNNPELEEQLVMHMAHGVRQTMHKAGAFVWNGDVASHVNKIAEISGFASTTHAAEHIANNFADPTDILQKFSPSSSKAFREFANFIDEDVEERPFWHTFVENNAIPAPNGKKRMQVLDLALLMRLDCYTSQPRNWLCVPEFKSGFELGPVHFNIPIDGNKEKMCPNYIQTNCFFCFSRFINAFYAVTTWISLFVGVTDSALAIVIRYPIFGALFDFILQTPAGHLPTVRQMLCATVIYLYDVIMVVLLIWFFLKFVLPLIKFIWHFIQHYLAHRTRLRTWIDTDHVRHTTPNYKFERFLYDRTLNPRPKLDATDSLLFSGGEMTHRNWYRGSVSKYMDHCEEPVQIGSEMNSFNPSADINLAELHENIDELEELLKEFEVHFGPPNQAHDYEEDVIRGTMFGLGVHLNTAPIYTYSISFFQDMVRVGKHKKSKLSGVLKSHVKQLCSKRRHLRRN